MSSTTRSSCRRGCRCSASRGSRAVTSTCSRRSPPTARSTCSCSTPPRRCGTLSPRPSRATAPCSIAGATPPPTSRAIGSSPPGAATPESSSSCSVRPADRSPSGTIPCRTAAQTPCSAGSRPTFAPIASRPGRRSPVWRTSGRRSTAQDDSIQIHACHGRARQVEVLRDAILHALEQDSTPRTPRHRSSCARTSRRSRRSSTRPSAPRAWPTPTSSSAAAVRTPKTTGRLGCPTSASVLPTGRCARRTRVLGVVAQLLELADQRAHRLAGARPRRSRAGAPPLPLRRRRPRADARLGRGRRAIRWGLDAAHRAPFGLDAARVGHVARGTGPDPARRDDDRGRPAAVRRRAAARRRRQRRIDLAGRFAELVDRADTRRSMRCAPPSRSTAWVGGRSPTPPTR